MGCYAGIIMFNMASSILLINFTEKQAERVRQALPIRVELGYASDGVERTNQKGDPIRLPEFDVPPIYEYAVTFVNLSSVKGLEQDYSPELADLRVVENFHKYWTERGGIIVYFLGNYTYDDMLGLGIESVALSPANKRDKAVNFISSKEYAHITEAFKKLKPTIKTPFSHYIEPTGKWIKDRYGKPEMRDVYRNLNGDVLGVYVDYAGRFDDEASPKAILLPEFSDNIAATIEILKALARDDPDIIPEIAEQDWATLDKLYPAEVGAVDDEIKKAINEARAKVDALNAKKDNLKETYSFLPLLLTATGDELKMAVIDALSFLGLAIKNVDETNKGDFAEDILISMPDDNEHKILAEVKGTKSKTPQDLYIGQVWKHIAQSDIQGIKTGALILNHDLMSDPNARPEAYGGKKEKELKDIIYIDTRELHKLILVVLDQGLNKTAATTMLLRTGRFTADTTEGAIEDNKES